MKRTHLISGSTSGMGAAIADRLASLGDDVIPLVRSHEVAKSRGISRYLACDFSEPESVRVACQNFEGEVDSFINAAGIAIGKPIWDNSPEEALRLLNVNLVSPMFACGALRDKIRPGGAIVLISSQSAYRGGWDDIYNASKGGINTFIKSFAIKVAPDIRVIGVAPGITVGTRMTNSRVSNDLDKIRETIPLKRFGNVENIAELVISIIGPMGSYMTGNVLDVNGGNYLR